jgi:predicted GIY-YIG superfamily endonuclease
MIYALLLEQGKIYVGYTERENGERFLEHFNGDGAKWTQKYKPIQVLEFKPGTKEDEHNLTIEYMKKYGWYNVRGAGYCQVEMTTCPKELMPPMPLEINKTYHPVQIKKTDKCFRCGRSGHLMTNCYAKTNSNSYYISDDSSSESDDECFRCGRSGHWANECYARTDINGRYIG